MLHIKILIKGGAWHYQEFIIVARESKLAESSKEVVCWDSLSKVKREQEKIVKFPHFVINFTFGRINCVARISQSKLSGRDEYDNKKIRLN